MQVCGGASIGLLECCGGPPTSTDYRTDALTSRLLRAELRSYVVAVSKPPVMCKNECFKLTRHVFPIGHPHDFTHTLDLTIPTSSQPRGHVWCDDLGRMERPNCIRGMIYDNDLLVYCFCDG